jgi:hypothetical protein
LRQQGYESAFDDKTLFYDVFDSKSGVALLGPPLLNLKPILSEGTIAVDGSTALDINHAELDRTSIVNVDGQMVPRKRVQVLSDEFSIHIPISPNFCSLFSGKRVLVTKSKDNALKWINDWVRFHVAEQSIDAVLIYDNESTAYGPEDVLEALNVEGIDVAVVVNWPFKFGPQGGNWDGLRNAPWDSDFCEYGVLEHARRRFLEDAAGVLNADIDELVVTSGNQNVFSMLEDSGFGVLSYAGRWIENYSYNECSPNSHSDYVHYDPGKGRATNKWALLPSKTAAATQWKTHSVSGVEMMTTEETVHRHFVGVARDWKWQRTKSRLTEANLRVDMDLKEAFMRVFPERNRKGVPVLK